MRRRVMDLCHCTAGTATFPVGLDCRYSECGDFESFGSQSERGGADNVHRQSRCTAAVGSVPNGRVWGLQEFVR